MQHTCVPVQRDDCAPVPHVTPPEPRASDATSWTFASAAPLLPPPSIELPLLLPVPLLDAAPLELEPDTPLLAPPLLPPRAPSRLTHTLERQTRPALQAPPIVHAHRSAPTAQF
jgi:hypothetical protein